MSGSACAFLTYKIKHKSKQRSERNIVLECLRVLLHKMLV